MMSRASEPGVCLVAEARQDPAWQARVAAALDATKAATLILVLPEGAATFDAASTRALIETAQRKSVAALIADDITTAKSLGADGVHLSFRPEIEHAYEAARSALGENAIVGADPGLSRHDAMELGEAGTDYVAFTAAPDTSPAESEDADDANEDALAARIAWWAEIFVVPVVAFVETPDEVREMVAHGADFIAVRLPADAAPDSDAAWARELRAALANPAHAA